MEHVKKSSVFDHIKVVSDELKPDRKPSFTNGDAAAADRDLCNPRISDMAFQAAYLDMVHFRRLPSENQT